MWTADFVSYRTQAILETLNECNSPQIRAFYPIPSTSALLRPVPLTDF